MQNSFYKCASMLRISVLRIEKVYPHYVSSGSGQILMVFDQQASGHSVGQCWQSQIDDFEHAEHSILQRQIGLGPSRAVVLDVGITSDAQNMIVDVTGPTIIIINRHGRPIEV